MTFTFAEEANPLVIRNGQRWRAPMLRDYLTDIPREQRTEAVGKLLEDLQASLDDLDQRYSGLEGDASIQLARVEFGNKIRAVLPHLKEAKKAYERMQEGSTVSFTELTKDMGYIQAAIHGLYRSLENNGFMPEEESEH